MEKYETAEKLDKDLSFDEADTLWEEIEADEKEKLERRLENLCTLQDETGRKLDKTSLKYHSRITGILEVKGKLLGDCKYYYRAWTYTLGADYLYLSDMAELAIDCYFRALIFQGNFEAKDEGKLLFRTIQGILACYRKMGDLKTMNFILPDFDAKTESIKTEYRLAYRLIRNICQGSQHEQELTDSCDRDLLKKIISGSFFAEDLGDLLQ